MHGEDGGGPAQPIEKSMAGASILAHVIVSKFADHQPLHRQEKMFERQGVRISRKTMGGWLAQVGELTGLEHSCRTLFVSTTMCPNCCTRHIVWYRLTPNRKSPRSRTITMSDSRFRVYPCMASDLGWAGLWCERRPRHSQSHDSLPSTRADYAAGLRRRLERDRVVGWSEIRRFASCVPTCVASEVGEGRVVGQSGCVR